METITARIWLEKNYAFCGVGANIHIIELKHTIRKRYVIKKLHKIYGKDITIEFR